MKRGQFVGRVVIGSHRYFGRWRVVVWKLARTASDQSNTLTAIKADNWRELAAEAEAYLLAQYGTMEIGGAPCPRKIARRAKWQRWAEANNTGKRSTTP